MIKYEGNLRGRERQWTFQLLKAGADLVSDDHDITLATGLRYGQNANTGYLDRLLLPASLDIGIEDPGSVIWQDIRNSGKFDFTLRVFDSNRQYEIDLYVRLASTLTPLKTDLQIPVTKLKCFCGLTRTKDQDANTTDFSTLHGVFKALLVDNLRTQNIQYLFSTHNVRQSTTKARVEALRFPDLDWLYKPDDEDPDKVEAAGDQLTDFLETFQMMCFNDFHYGRQWMVAQPWLLGQDHTIASDDSQLYVEDLDTVNESTYSDEPVPDALEDNTKRGQYDGDQSVVVTINKKRPAITDIIIDKGSFNEGWITGGNIFWEATDSTTLIETVEGAYIDDGAKEIWQDMLLVQQGKWLRVIIEFEFALEYTPAGAGDHSIGFKLQTNPMDVADDINYSTDAGVTETWTTVDTTIADGPYTPDANGTAPGSLTWRSASSTLADFMPNDALIQLRVLGDTGSDFFLHLRNYRVRFEDQASSAVTDTPPWPGRVQGSVAGNGITEGSTVTYNRPWHPVVFERDATDHKLVEVDVSVGSWEECNQWTDSLTGVEYWDLSQWQATIRLIRGGKHDFIKGIFYGILTPKSIILYGGKRYVVVYVDIDLHTETTQFLAYEDLIGE